ncbi:MAG TPA: N-acetylglucosamine-6-phosphate deacetylase [Burkholderiaceae bacterium]|nr:N-acetylglucosamine-6-phosphate deacetylase [Burkholderiaceae bacterium]
MSSRSELQGRILTPAGFVDGTITIDAAGRVEAIGGTPVALQAARDTQARLILPGFIDLHVHGGGGHDVMEGGDAARHIATLHAQHGTTSMLATTMTAPMADIEAAFAALTPLFAAPRNAKAARILGVHLEGPYINPGKLGAQPDYARPLDGGEIRRLHALAPIRLITLAPEVAGNIDVIESLVAAGYRVQVGHSLASYEQVVSALERGASGFTHLYNAMSALHHREPGVVGAALAHATRSEIIPDLLHVHAGAIKVALRAIPCLYCVTDSTAASGMPDGEYKLGRHTVTKCLGGVRLPDGTLAGSTLTMDQALRNLVEHIGLDLADASRRVSTFAADHVGWSDRGRLQRGAWADLVVLDRDLQITDVYVEGNPV